MPNPGFATCGVIMGWVGAFWGAGGKNWGVFSGAGCAAVWQSGGWLGLVGRAVVDREVIADAGL